MYEVKSESFLHNVNRLLRIKASIYVLNGQGILIKALWLEMRKHNLRYKFAIY